jgi:hypothetical protein
VPNPEGLLIPGGVVGVIVERGAPRSALMVPQSAVLLDQAGRYVLVVDEAKKVELRRVTTGVDGSVVRVKDVARLEMGAKSQDISTSTRPSSGRCRIMALHSSSKPAIRASRIGNAWLRGSDGS